MGSYKRHLTAADRRAKEVIKAAAEAGVEIVSLEVAPRFRFTPRGDRAAHYGPPSKRGSVACGSNPLKLRSWSPTRLDANPMYFCPMMGDDPALTAARSRWHHGHPEDLRLYLARLAGKEGPGNLRDFIRRAA